MTDDSAGLMLRYGTQLSTAGVTIPGGPLGLVTVEPPADPTNVIDLDCKRRERAEREA